MIIRKLTEGFIDVNETLSAGGGGFGSFDKGRLADFEIDQQIGSKPIEVRFFISYLDGLQSHCAALSDEELMVEVYNELESMQDREFRSINLLYLYNFSTCEFFLFE